MVWTGGGSWVVEGAAVGTLGTGVRSVVGTAVGFGVFTVVGDWVRTVVGAAVGDWVLTAVGDWVLTEVGAAVGAWVLTEVEAALVGWALTAVVVAWTPVLVTVPVVVVPASVPGTRTGGMVVTTLMLPSGFRTIGLEVTSPETGAAAPNPTGAESCSMYAVGVALTVLLAVMLAVILPVAFTVVFTAVLFSEALAVRLPSVGVRFGFTDVFGATVALV